MGKIQVNLNKPLLRIDGKHQKITEDNDIDNLGKALGSALAFSQNEGNSIKLSDWGFSLWKGEVLEIDDSDLTTLKEFVKNSRGMTNIGAGQVLKALNAIKVE